MPLKNGKLTGRERALARVYAATDDQAYAAHKAGFASEAGASMALKRPAVVSMVNSERRARMARLEDKALTTVEACMDASTATWREKLHAADIVIKHRTLGEDSEAKEPSEMSADEIQATIRALQFRQTELEDNAKDVTPVESSSAGVFD